MGVIFSLLLIVLGALAARDYLNEKVPSLRPTLAALEPYGSYIGLAGLLVGLVWVLQMLSILNYISLNPFAFLVALAASLLTLALGFMLGLPALHKLMNNPTPGFLLKADGLAAKLRLHSNRMGAAAAVLGILSFFA